MPPPHPAPRRPTLPLLPKQDVWWLGERDEGKLGALGGGTRCSGPPFWFKHTYTVTNLSKACPPARFSFSRMLRPTGRYVVVWRRCVGVMWARAPFPHDFSQHCFFSHVFHSFFTLFPRCTISKRCVRALVCHLPGMPTAPPCRRVPGLQEGDLGGPNRVLPRYAARHRRRGRH